MKPVIKNPRLPEPPPASHPYLTLSELKEIEAMRRAIRAERLAEKMEARQAKANHESTARYYY